MAGYDSQNEPQPDSEHTAPDAGELTPGNAQEGFSDEATSVLHYDPFEEGMDGDTQESDTSGEEGEGYAGEEQPGEQGEGQAAAPAEGSEQGAAANQGQEETELQRLQRELYERDQLLSQYTQQSADPNAQAQGQAQGQQPAGDAQSSIPDYSFRIPDQMWEQIESDDPNERRQGIGQLLQGVAQAVHQQVQTEYQQKLESLKQQELPQTINQTVEQRERQREVYNDFYGTYPDLNHPQLRSVVQQAGQQEASLRQARGQSVEWNADFRDAVAQRVYTVMGRQPSGQAQGQAQTQAQPQRSPRGQPANLGRGSAPRAAPQGEARSQQQDVIDTLFG